VWDLRMDNLDRIKIDNSKINKEIKREIK